MSLDACAVRAIRPLSCWRSRGCPVAAASLPWRGGGRGGRMAAASGEWEAPSRALRALTWLAQEFMSDWEAQDLRAALFQLLLLWLFVSLLGIQVAWRVYGNTVTGLYYRQAGSGACILTGDWNSKLNNKEY